MARNALTSIENAYNDKINMLKEKLTNERKDRHVSSVAQRDVIRIIIVAIIEIGEGIKIR